MLVLLFQLHKTVAVVESRFRIVDGARTNDDEEAAQRIRVLHDRDAFFPAVLDGGSGLRGLSNLVLEEVGCCERIVASDCRSDKSVCIG